MSYIPDFTIREIFDRVYEKADQIFPEFGFKKPEQSNYWLSCNKRKIDGSEGDKLSPVYYYPDRPYRFRDVTRPRPGTIVTYLKEHRGYSSWIDAIKYLAREAGVSLPDQHLTEEQIKKTEEKHHKINLYESINDYFISCLNDEANEEAKKHIEYIKNRGYSGHDLELGFIPSHGSLKQHLLSLGFAEDEINKFFFDAVNYYIGSSHQLTIPFMDQRGDLVSFVFRDIQLEKGNKYQFMTGFKKGDYLFNLKNNRKNRSSLVLVEGLPDSITLHIHGMDNVVALGGVSISDEQIKLIKASGVDKIILCLDADTAGIEATPRVIEKIISSGINLPLYVVSWPESCKHKDPDELIKAEGIDSFKPLIENAKTWFNYLASNVLENVSDNISDQGRDTAIKELISIGAKIKRKADRDLFYSETDNKGEPLKISRDTLQAEIERERQAQEEKKQIEAIREKTETAASLLNKGDKNGALEILGNISKQSNIELSKISYDELFKPITREDIISNLNKESDAFDTGLKISKSPLLIPSGATTYIAGRTGRGKTATLINIAVNSLVNEISDNRPVVFFSYEENSRKILMKFLNIYIGNKFSDNNRHCIRDYYNQRDARFVSTEMRNEFIRLEKNFFDFFINTGRLIIVDSQDCSSDLINKISYLHKNKNVRAILIDYIQRITLKESKKVNRHEELKIICNDLVDCSIKVGLPIISGSQFNRQATDDRATLTLTNLGEAGDIERSANMVIAVDIKHNDIPNQPSEFYMKILKNRDGVSEISDDSLIYDGNTGKISNNSLNRF